MKFYRTYITTFSRSDGMKVYVGKRTSRYQNPSDDPYYGSGNQISRAVSKYGKCCIVSIVWFNHTRETLDYEEMKLISIVRGLVGDTCVNIADGGSGGDTMKYSSPVDKEARSRKLSKFHSIFQNTQDTKRMKSDYMKLRWKDIDFAKSMSTQATRLWRCSEFRERILAKFRSIDSRERRRSKLVEMWKCPSFRSSIGIKMSDGWTTEKRMEHSKKTSRRMRKSKPHWDLYYSGEMLNLFQQSGCSGYKPFKRWLDENTEYRFSVGQIQSVMKEMRGIVK